MGNCMPGTSRMPTAASDVKLIAHRWAMHAVQALSHRDAELLERVFKDIPDLPNDAVNTRVKAYGYGAPIQLHDYGFFDRQSQSGHSTALLDNVRNGDTLLLIALRQHDPASAAALIRCGASLNATNKTGELPIEIIFDAFAYFKLVERPANDSTHASALSKTPAGRATDLLVAPKESYQKLFALIHEKLLAYHDASRDRVVSKLMEIYTTLAPERLAKLDAQLEEYAFRELSLLAAVQRKFGLSLGLVQRATMNP